MSWLNYRQQNLSFGLARSLFHLTEAKQFAEVDRSVGPLRQMVCLWPGGWKGLEGGDKLIQGWWNRFGLPMSDGLGKPEDDNEVRKIYGLG